MAKEQVRRNAQGGDRSLFACTHKCKDDLDEKSVAADAATMPKSRSSVAFFIVRHIPAPSVK